MPKLLPEREYGEALSLRENSLIPGWPINFIFNKGGMGDFVNYSAATLWIAKNSPWLQGKLFCPRYLVPLMKDVHQGFKNWQVFASEDVAQHMTEGTSYLGPDVIINGINRTPQFLTCVGAHQIDVAAAYYIGTSPAPSDCLLPILDYPRSRLLPKVKRLRVPYAVIPTGFSAEARSVKGRHINPILKYLNAKGIMPVFLGKKDLLGDGVTISRFPDDIDYSLGLDLRDETAVKDAACIMQHAAFTLGLDCGLLHLAALMKDSKIIFAYNITSVEHRAPRRNHGTTVHVTVPREELVCIGCQSNLKLYPVHKFTTCLYGDAACIDLLFKNDGERFRPAIDEMLEAH